MPDLLGKEDIEESFNTHIASYFHAKADFEGWLKRLLTSNSITAPIAALG